MEPPPQGSSQATKTPPLHTSSQGGVASDARQQAQHLQKVMDSQRSFLQDLSKLYLLTQTVSKFGPRGGQAAGSAQPQLLARRGDRDGGGDRGRATSRVIEQSQVFDYSNRRNVLLQLEAAHAREEGCESEYRQVPGKGGQEKWS